MYLAPSPSLTPRPRPQPHMNLAGPCMHIDLRTEPPRRALLSKTKQRQYPVWL